MRHSQKIPAHDPPPPPQKSRAGGVASKIPDTPLPPVLFFRELTPTPPVLHKTGDYPPLLPVPKGVFRVEHQAKWGGGTTPSVTDKGGGYRMEGAGVPPSIQKLWIPSTPCPKFFLPAPPPPTMIAICRTGRSQKPSTRLNSDFPKNRQICTATSVHPKKKNQKEEQIPESTKLACPVP